MLKRAWKPVTASIVVGAPAYYYYTTSARTPGSSTNQTFNIQVRVKNALGKREMSTRSIPLLSTESVEEKIRANQKAATMEETKAGGKIWKYTTASIAANDPLEDANAHAFVTREDTDPSAPGDLMFFAVMDGHGGHYTSQLLSKTLISAVMLELNQLVKPEDKTTGGIVNTITSLWKSPSWTPTRVSESIADAFVKFDAQLLLAPITAFVNAVSKEDLENFSEMKEMPDLSSNEMARSLMQAAVTGSCALLAMFDTAHQDLYVASTGDCRAVAGVWEEGEDGKGHWRAEVLTEDQTGRNPKEKLRWEIMFFVLFKILMM